MPDSRPARRPLKTRNTSWARWLACRLATRRVSPNAISVFSLVFAGLGALAMLAAPLSAPEVRWVWLIAAAVCIQLRLLCNLLDGMVAIEGGKQSPTGALYNEFPDRIADSLFLVALGVAAGEPWLGWLCALLAAITAYIRVTGGSLGLAQEFRGPMAKPHRMAAMTLACLLAAAELHWRGSGVALLVAAWVIALGTVLTCVLRTRAIAQGLHARQASSQ